MFKRRYTLRVLPLAFSLLTLTACSGGLPDYDDLIPARIANVKDMGEGVAIVLQSEGAPPVSIFIGHWEARALVMAMEEEEFPRPLSYDLLEQALERVEGEVRHLVVHSLKDNTYYGKLYIDMPDGEWVLDCRPSDGMVIVTRSGAPIYLAPQLFKKAIPIRRA